MHYENSSVSHICWSQISSRGKFRLPARRKWWSPVEHNNYERMTNSRTHQSKKRLVKYVTLPLHVPNLPASRSWEQPRATITVHDILMEAPSRFIHEGNNYPKAQITPTSKEW